MTARTEQCVCRGYIHVHDVEDEDAVFEAVRSHNAGPIHVAWRLRLRYTESPRSITPDGLPVYVPVPEARA